MSCISELGRPYTNILQQYGQSPLLQEIQLRIKDRWSRTKPNPLLLYAANQVTERLSNPTDDPDLLNSFIKLQKSDPGRVSDDEIAGALYINL
jgi:cytochrome P450